MMSRSIDPSKRLVRGWGTGMLPGDIVWDFIKKTGELDYDEGYVIDEGADGFQCKDCKYHMSIDKRYIYS